MEKECKLMHGEEFQGHKWRGSVRCYMVGENTGEEDSKVIDRGGCKMIY